MAGMAASVEISELGKLVGAPSVMPLNGRRFRSTAVTVHPLEPNEPWRWLPQPRDFGELALVAYVQSPATFIVDSIAFEVRNGFFLHPHKEATISTVERAQVLCIWVPWDALEELDTGELGCFAVSPTSPLIAGVRAFGSALMTRAAAGTPYTDYLVEKLLAEMAFGVLLEAGRAADGSIRESAAARSETILDRARTVMLLRRADAAFGVEELALDLHVSTRQLQRAFADEPTTPATELRRLRVELAIELLGNEAYAPLSMKEIAFHSGFASAAALRRAFAGEELELPPRAGGGQNPQR